MTFAKTILSIGMAAMFVNAAAAATGPSFTAVVDADGTLVRGLKATAASHQGKGTYEVDFTQDVTACSWVGAVGLSGSSGTSDPGMIGIVGRSGTPTGLYIRTYTPKGKSADLGFHLIVNC